MIVEKDPYDDGSNNTNRYMAITLTDLKWTIDLFLFDNDKLNRFVSSLCFGGGMIVGFRIATRVPSEILYPN
jgi:hypothetical protein